MDDTAITRALGLDSSFGYHVEEEPAPPRLPIAQQARERPAVPWYPCIDTNAGYSGCLGEGCPLEVCWTGSPSISYAAALRRRFHPTDAEYAPGARCLTCRHVRETTIATLDQRHGMIHLPVLHCAQGCWTHPITAAAFVRRRIPTAEDVDLATCPRYEQAAAPIPVVEQRRLQVNEQARARRAGRERPARQHG